MKADDASTWNLPVQVSKIPTKDELAKLEADAEKGDAEAQTDLGILYYRGRGVPKDYAKAVELWRKAAAQGDAQAENNLGEAHEAGAGVPQNYEEAAKWNLKAAEQGHPVAQFELGGMYATGRGVSRDLVKAYVWSSLAAERDIKPAKANLDKIAGQMTPDEKAESETLLKLKKSTSLSASD